MNINSCPFCGQQHTLEIIRGSELMDEDQEYWMHSESFAVICSAAKPNGKGGCGATGGFMQTEVEAVNVWNRRAAAPQAMPVQEPVAKDVNSAHTLPSSDCILSNNDYHEAEIAIMGHRLFRAVERMTNPAGESAHEMVDWLCDDSGMFKLFEKYFSPAAAPQAKPLITREQHFALREAFAIGAADSYFEAYPTHDNSVGRMIFERGFVRGFDSHERAIEAAHGIKE